MGLRVRVERLCAQPPMRPPVVTGKLVQAPRAGFGLFEPYAGKVPRTVLGGAGGR